MKSKVLNFRLSIYHQFSVPNCRLFSSICPSNLISLNSLRKVHRNWSF